MYEQAVTQLTAAADDVAEFRADLAAFADNLGGKKWGVAVTGPISDMDGQLVALEGDYRDLAGQMKHQGDRGAAAHEQAPWVPDDLLAHEFQLLPGTGSPTMAEQPSTDHPQVPEEDDEQEPEPEMYTHCWGCDQLLEKPTPEYGKAYHVDCDPDTPPKYWMGALTANRKKINHNQAEGYCRLQDLAADAFDSVLEWETPLGDTFISFPDGSIVDAREWIERPENIELAGGRDRYAGCGEFDPAAPDRCWLGQTLPSGRIARPGARSFDDVAELATAVCRSVFEDRWGIDRDRPYLAMLPGGEFVDALDWAQLPDTRRLAGCTTVRNRVRFRATDTCPTCRAEVSTVCTRIVQGEIGEECFATAAIRCDACDVRLSRGVFIPIILVDDASAITGAPPRVIGDAD